MSTSLWIVLACSGDPGGTDPEPSDTSSPATTGDTGLVTDTGDCTGGAFVDGDGDGYGDPSRPIACEEPSAVADGTDCDDLDAAVHPGASERCDGIDGDCDPSTSEDGLATLHTVGGAVLDLTGTLAVGGERAPVVMDLEDGRYDFCAGTWYTRLRGVQTSTTIDGHGGAVLDGGHAGSVIALDGGEITLVDLTVTGGQGSVAAPNGAGLTGGGMACFGDAVVTSTRTTFVDNTAEIGGAWFVDACVVSATDTTLTGNTATYGGGMYMFAGEVTFTTSTVTSNTATSSGGGLGLEGTGRRPSLTLIDSVVSDNLAAFGGGLVTYENAEALCVGGVGVEAGFFRNTATGPGGATYLTGADFAPRFTSSGCDFGIGPDDNVPGDIVTAYAEQLPYSYGDDVSFSCDRYGCL